MQTTLKVTKMECSSCAILMEEICEETTGVTRAEVDARKRTIAIECDSENALHAAMDALAKEGYPVEPLKE